MPSETPPLVRGGRLRVESPGAVRARRGIVRLARAEESTHRRELRGAERAVAGPDPRRSRRRRRASRIGTPLGRLGVPIAVAALDVWRLARSVRWTHTSRATRCGDGVVVTAVVAVAGSHGGGRRPRRDVIRWEKRVVGGEFREPLERVDGSRDGDGESHDAGAEGWEGPVGGVSYEIAEAAAESSERVRDARRRAEMDVLARVHREDGSRRRRRGSGRGAGWDRRRRGERSRVASVSTSSPGGDAIATAAGSASAPASTSSPAGEAGDEDGAEEAPAASPLAPPTAPPLRSRRRWLRRDARVPLDGIPSAADARGVARATRAREGRADATTRVATGPTAFRDDARADAGAAPSALIFACTERRVRTPPRGEPRAPRVMRAGRRPGSATRGTRRRIDASSRSRRADREIGDQRGSG